ncbi:hypothetical protein [Bordetella trematum]|uniref:hypothetical protein n=1 Tax=Bordetella trematum TaxID=123899 RepID=UPI000B24A2B3|nr:hypothetical protein [Bordetella trematum]
MALSGAAQALLEFGIGLAWPHLLRRVFSAAAPAGQALAGSCITTIQRYATAPPV